MLEADNNPTSAPTGMSIAAVERDTGLGKDTLRVWERRYGFPVPQRDVHGERIYPLAQVERLHRIKHLMDLGWRPGKIFASTDAELDNWLAQQAPARSAATAETAEPGLIDLVRMHRNEELRASLQQCLLKQGLERFVMDTIAPLNVAVGEAWVRGIIDIADEHLYTEHVQNLLRSAIGQRGETRRPPRVLLTTFPDEPHALGLLMVESLLVSEGAHCVSLGTRTPLADINAAMQTGSFDILTLSFSSAFPQRHAISGLLTLSADLPPGCEIWAGGGGVAQRMPVISRVRLLGPLSSVLAALQQWRDERSN